MTGMFRWTVGDKVRVHEFLLMEQEGRHVTMRLRHFGAAMKAWEDAPLLFRLEEIGDRMAVFLEPDKESPKRLVYELSDTRDALSITLIEPQPDGKDHRFSFPLKRLKHD